MQRIGKLEEVFDPSLFTKVYKMRVCREEGKCDRCPWHSGENYSNYYRRLRKSWKKKRRIKWSNIPEVW